jgi:hypothetical protein
MFSVVRALFRFLGLVVRDGHLKRKLAMQPTSTADSLPIDPVTETVVTIPQAAAHYCVSKPTMWRWVLSGRVASIKLGGARRTTLEAVARSVAFEA